jgi:hypothetical protein
VSGEDVARSRPPAPPRCPECGGPHGSKSWQPRHLPDCSIHLAAQAHRSNIEAVEKALAEAVAERRQDRPFMERLARRLQEDDAILDRLAGDPSKRPPALPEEERRKRLGPRQFGRQAPSTEGGDLVTTLEATTLARPLGALPSDRVLHDPTADTPGICPECDEPWPCVERKRQRSEIRWIADYLRSDLYKRAPSLDTDPQGVRWASPLGWSVWWTYGMSSVPMTIRDPEGKPYASTTNGTREWLDEVLP